MRRKERPALPDPNCPGSPAYSERHRQFSCELPQGFRRIDSGSPIAAPGRTVQEVSEVRPQEPEGSPTESPADSPTPPATQPAQRDWRKEYGLGKGT